jgi:hypothetical protein
MLGSLDISQLLMLEAKNITNLQIIMPMACQD